EKHHKEITHLNGIQSRKYNYTKLSNRFRWWIWFQWIEGKLKVRNTKKAQEWTDGWGRQPTVLPIPEPVLINTSEQKKPRKRKKVAPKKKVTTKPSKLKRKQKTKR